MKKEKYEFIDKTVYFPKIKTLAIGDLHLGYETMLKKQGISIPFNQTKKTIEELGEILKYLAKSKKDVKKIILLGDIKHYFSFNEEEEKDINKIIEFLKKKAEVICIQGNHDKTNIHGIDFQDFYIKNDIAFLHGHKSFPEIYEKKINLIVMSHIHPTVTLKDEQNVKSEKYKCFLVGKLKEKEVLILPSFFSLTEGGNIEDEEDFSIIPNDKIKNFEVFVCQDVEKNALNFGKLKNYI